MPNLFKLIGIAILGFVILVALAFLGQKDPTPEEQARKERVDALIAGTKAKRDELVKKAVKDGLVRKVTCQANEAQVPLATWLDADADAKKSIAIVLAAWCEDQQSGNRITIIDAQSGRTLASYDGRTYRVH